MENRVACCASSVVRCLLSIVRGSRFEVDNQPQYRRQSVVVGRSSVVGLGHSDGVHRDELLKLGAIGDNH